MFFVFRQLLLSEYFLSRFLKIFSLIFLVLCFFIDIFSEWISALLKVVVANGSRKFVFCFGVLQLAILFFNIFFCLLLIFFGLFLGSWGGVCDVFRNKI